MSTLIVSTWTLVGLAAAVPALSTVSAVEPVHERFMPVCRTTRTVDLRAGDVHREFRRLRITPTLVIGGRGRAEEQLREIVGLARLSDGSIVVVDDRYRGARLFRDDGALLRVIRDKRSRAEALGAPRFVLLAGDSIALQDPGAERVSVFLPHDGRMARSFPEAWGRERRHVTLVGALADNAFLATESVPPGDVTVPGLHAAPANLVVLSASGLRLRTVGRVIEHDFAFVARSASPSDFARFMAPWGRHTDVKVDGEEYVTGEGSQFEARRFRRDGACLIVLRVRMAPRPITTLDGEYERDRILAFHGIRPGPTFERFWSSASKPRHLPAYRRMELDDRGNAWFELYPSATDTTARWLVFDRSFNYLGSVTAPGGVQLRVLFRDGVLGVQRVGSSSVVKYYQFAD